MNLFIGSGKLTRNAIVNGTDNKAVKFTIAAKNRENAKNSRVEFIPCVLFNPPEEIEEFLKNDGKGVPVKFEGRVANSKFQVDGQNRYKTEVIVDEKTFNIMKN